MTKVISIQSQVLHGHVGNSAAVFPMQAKGLEVVSVPTAILTNHPHYPTMHGRVFEPELLAALLLGVEERGLVEQASVIITGFLASAANAQVVADFMQRARRSNPDLLYVCDPVMGDDDLGVFVKPELIPLFREALVPLASIITPNQYELELLAEADARTQQDLEAAMASLHQRGMGAAVVTGCVMADTPAGWLESVAWSPRNTPDSTVRTATPRLPIRPCGTGDLFTALLVARLCDGSPLAEAAKGATQEMTAVLQRTQDAGTEEMRIIGFPFAQPFQPEAGA
ncbi:pyridoxal kinase [Altererythrobacter xixiisoli]|uniref:pyridoxal kinase n=1 Tax=Croceibacterium xixiisoli TaxID=1476466 RepID=A0A6I4TWX7_9SPHN|nr:pyridoxal kinase [Croceibacterium xixiisoli]MXP00666.1 pyridoxal kinase [Croceibacterium xixiisoli]